MRGLLRSLFDRSVSRLRAIIFGVPSRVSADFIIARDQTVYHFDEPRVRGRYLITAHSDAAQGVLLNAYNHYDENAVWWSGEAMNMALRDALRFARDLRGSGWRVEWQ